MSTVPCDKSINILECLHHHHYKSLRFHQCQDRQLHLKSIMFIYTKQVGLEISPAFLANTKERSSSHGWKQKISTLLLPGYWISPPSLSHALKLLSNICTKIIIQRRPCVLVSNKNQFQFNVTTNNCHRCPQGGSKQKSS